MKQAKVKERRRNETGPRLGKQGNTKEDIQKKIAAMTVATEKKMASARQVILQGAESQWKTQEAQYQEDWGAQEGEGAKMLETHNRISKR